jgi:hypothetical protein
MENIYLLVNKNYNTNVKVTGTDKNDTAHKINMGYTNLFHFPTCFCPSEPSSGRTIITGNYRRMEQLHPQTSGGNYATLQYFQVVFFSLNMTLQG